MFEAIIYGRIPDAYSQLIGSALNTTRPTEIASSFSDNPNKSLKLKAQIFINQTPLNLDDVCKAPHLLLYFFHCTTKDDFLKTELQRYLNFHKANRRDYISLVPIFISKGSVKKSKLFGQSNSFITYMQSQLTNLQVIEIKSSGEVSNSGIQKIWSYLTSQISHSQSLRITYIRSQIIKQPATIDTFRYAFRLCLLYEQVSLYQKCIESLDEANKLVTKNNNLLKFIEPQDLFNRFDFTAPIETICNQIFTKVSTEYLFKFVFMKERVKILLASRNTIDAITTSFSFLQSNFHSIETNPSVSQYDYNIWITQALYDIQRQILKGKKSKSSLPAQQCISIMEMYIDQLPIVYQLYSQKNKENLDLSDPLFENPQLDAPTQSAFADLEQILMQKQTFTNEMTRSIKNLISFCNDNGFSRKSALHVNKLRKYLDPDDYNKYKAQSTMTIIKKGYPHLCEDITQEMINNISLDDRIYVCCRILGDHFSKNREMATSILSNLLTMKSTKQKYKQAMNLPIRLTFYHSQDEPEKTYIEGEKAMIPIQVHCNFPGKIKCNRLLVGLMSWKFIKNIYFDCSDVEIYDGCIINVTNTFAKPGPYVIYNLRLQASTDQLINVILPSSKEILHVDPRPLAFDFEIDLPKYLLPRRWQLARLKVTMREESESLELKISGTLSYRPAALRLNNNEKRDPEDGLIYSNVIQGVHDIYLPINPTTTESGQLKIEAVANKQSISREAKYRVSEFLELKLLYRRSTKVAQLTAFVKSKTELSITGVDFFGKESAAKLETESIGVPFNVQHSISAAMFILQQEPATCNVWVKQKGLKEFSLSLNVEVINEDASPKDEEEVVQSPLTILVPLGFSV